MAIISSRLRKWVGVLLAASSVGASAASTHLTHVQVLKFPSYVRVIFSMNDPDRYHVFALSNPHRLVVDFNNAQLKADLQHVDLTGSHIVAVRSGTPKPSTLRVVFDLNTSAHFKSFIAADNHTHEGQVVVDISPIEKTPEKSIAKREHVFVPPKKPFISSAKAQPIEKHPYVAKFVPLGPPPSVAVLKPSEPKQLPAVQSPAVPKPHAIVVVIDPGHGGKDPGTVGTNGGKEKEIVLGIAIRLAAFINKEPNMHAVLTRQGDYFITLRDRLRLARKNKADLFVSIHADAYQNDQSTGVSVYALSRHGATSEAARWLARRENYSELGGVDFGELGDKSYVLRSVLIDLAQTATITDSVRLGADVLSALENVTKLHYPHVEQAPFVVLKSPDIPSVLIETGYLSNPKEESRLRSAEYREQIARAVLVGVQNYIMNHPPIGV